MMQQPHSRECSVPLTGEMTFTMEYHALAGGPPHMLPGVGVGAGWYRTPEAAGGIGLHGYAALLSSAMSSAVLGYALRGAGR